MNKRFGINLLAAAVIAVGGFALTGATPATAAVFGGCEDMRAALQEDVNQCAGMGGTSLSYSGSCGSEGYTLSTTCHVD